MWYSKQYDDAPMPYSVFFKGGYAIHGTGYVSQLGRPASHGCIRVPMFAARRLPSMISHLTPVFVYGCPETQTPPQTP